MKELPVRVYSEQALDEYLARAGIADGRTKTQPVRQEPRPATDSADEDDEQDPEPDDGQVEA
ncbi:MAG: hypothetical protein U0W40_04810 [Acidimicrobiia bacterium]